MLSTGGDITTVTTPELFKRLGRLAQLGSETAAERGRLMEIGCRVALLSSMAKTAMPKYRGGHRRGGTLRCLAGAGADTTPPVWQKTPKRW